MGARRKERRNVIDRIPLSEFFALICTGLMLLTLFLISSVVENPTAPSATVSAGAGISIKPAPLPATLEEPLSDVPSEDDKKKIPTRSLNLE